MRTFRLELFHTTCASCGTHFESLQHTIDDGCLVYEVGQGSFQFLDTFADPVWDEVSRIVEELLGHGITARDDVQTLHRLLPASFDRHETGGTFHSAEAMPRCPQCSGAERTSFGPYVPGQFRDVEMSPVTHRTWFATAPADRRDLLERLLSGQDEPGARDE